MDTHRGECVELRDLSRSDDPESRLPSKSVNSINKSLDFTVLPLLALIYAFNGLDKSSLNLVAAGSEEFMRQANLTPADINRSVSCYYASWIIFSFATMTAQKIGIKYYLAVQVMLTGVACAAHAGIRSSGDLIALRVLLGMAEAGFTGNAINLLAEYYPMYSLGVRIGLFAGAYTLGEALGPLISYAQLQIPSTPQDLASWQLIFYFEGAVTVALGVVVSVVLPDDLETAWFLSAEQKGDVALRRGAVDEGPTDREPVSKADILTVLKDWRIMLLIAHNIFLAIPITGVNRFIVLIVKDMGYSGLQANLMSIPLFAVGTVTAILLLYASDRKRERTLFAIVSLGVVNVGLLVVAYMKDNKIRYILLTVCSGAGFASPLLSAALLAHMSPNARIRSVVMCLNGFANVGTLIARQVFQVRYAPAYGPSVTVMAWLLDVSIFSLLILLRCAEPGRGFP